MPDGHGGYRSVLAIHDARALIAASAASQLGDWLYNAALLGYVYSATGSAAWVGAATICRLLPYVILGPVGGTMADRYDRRRVLLIGDLVRLALMLALAAVVATEGHVVFVIALTALASAAGAAEKPAAMALLPRLVGETRLGPANALLHTVQDVGVVLGPAIGALILAVAPASVAFTVNAATFALSAAFISTLRVRGAGADGKVDAGVVGQIRHGLRTARHTPFVIPLFLVVAMVEFTYGAQTVQLVLYADRQLGLDEGGYGVLLAALGVGGVLSAIVNGRLSTSTRVSLIVVGTGGAVCASQLGYAAIDLVALAVFVSVIAGAAMVTAEVVAETALTRIVPADVLGRVMGVFDAMSVAAMVIGALLAPLLITGTSLRTSFVVLGAIALAVTLLCLGALRGLDELSHRRAAALASRVAVIEGLPITQGVPRLVLEQLASASQICPIPDGVNVVVQGAPAHAFYVVIDGGVVVHRDGDVLAHLGAGQCFGERGLLDNAPRNATVTTEVPSHILRLEGDVLLDALQSSATLVSALDRSIAGRVVPPRPADVAFVDDLTWSDS
jgi:MFS family permease